MILSQKNKVLYVAVPKTASTAVQDWLLKENEGFVKGKHRLNGKEVYLKEHITAIKARELLGCEYYDSLNIIAFIREPYSKLVSSYFFYKQGGKTKSILSKNTNNIYKRYLHTLQFIIAKILPFWLWSLIYPYKDNKRYCVNQNDNIIVSHIGIYENLFDDMNLFLKDIGLKVNIENLSYLNKSSKKAKGDFLKNKLFKKILFFRHKKFEEDLIFYNQILSNLILRNCTSKYK